MRQEDRLVRPSGDPYWVTVLATGLCAFRQQAGADAAFEPSAPTEPEPLATGFPAIGHPVLPEQSGFAVSRRGHLSLQISSPVRGQVIFPGQSALPVPADANL